MALVNTGMYTYMVLYSLMVWPITSLSIHNSRQCHLETGIGKLFQHWENPAKILSFKKRIQLQSMDYNFDKNFRKKKKCQAFSLDFSKCRQVLI